MFKVFLEKKLEDEGKQIEQRSKLDKGVLQLKSKGKQKQFELNAELDTIFESIESEVEIIEPNLSHIKKLSQEARQRIRKRQKLINSLTKIETAGRLWPNTSRTSLHLVPKMKNVLRRQEKRRAARDAWKGTTLQ